MAVFLWLLVLFNSDFLQQSLASPEFNMFWTPSTLLAAKFHTHLFSVHFLTPIVLFEIEVVICNNGLWNCPSLAVWLRSLRFSACRMRMIRACCCKVASVQLHVRFFLLFLLVSVGALHYFISVCGLITQVNGSASINSCGRMALLMVEKFLRILKFLLCIFHIFLLKISLMRVHLI